MDLQEQIKAYTVWVNSQLKKRSLKIRDLKTDLTDGTVLVSVVEIVSGSELKSIKAPKTDAEKRINMESVFTFMRNQKINLNHIAIEDLLTGNVKSLMQLILALAAHFKPASISEKASGLHHNRQTTQPHREKRSKKLSNETVVSNTKKETVLHQEMGADIENIKNLAQNLQKILLDEIDDMPLNNLSAMEDTLLLNAKLNQAETDKLNLEKEIFELKHECRKLDANCNATELRLKEQQDEILNLRQALMQGNLERGRLKSDKTEFSIQIADIEKDRDKYRQRFKEYETMYRQLKDNSLLSPVNRFFPKDSSPRSLESPTFHSPVMSTSPNNRLGYKISRRSPVTRRRGTSRKKDPGSDVTRVLYFADKEMTPAMTTIASRVGDITLGDFRKAVKRERGDYRFIFKALDPELGTVKEEVFNDEDIVPGWEGKIVAWVEQV